MSFSAIFLIARSYLATQPGRQVAAVLAIALVGSLVVASVGAYRIYAGDMAQNTARVVGGEDVILVATDPLQRSVPEDSLAELRGDPRVTRLIPFGYTPVFRAPALADGSPDPADSGSGTATHAWSLPPEWEHATLDKGRRPRPGQTPIEVARVNVDGPTYSEFKGEEILRLEAHAGIFPVRVVGEMSGITLPMWQHLFLTPEDLQRIAGHAVPPERVLVRLATGVDRQAFAEEWRGRLSALPGRIEVSTAAEVLRKGDHNTEWTRTAARLVIAICMICLFFIALASQSTAVSERARQYALLRSIGLSRAGVVGVVLGEALLVSALGWLGAVLLGWAWLAVAISATGFTLFMFADNAVPGAPDVFTIAVTALAVATGVLAGALVPALLATRVRPGEVTQELAARSRSTRLPMLPWIAGLCLLPVSPLIAFGMKPGPMRADLDAWVGTPSRVLAISLLAVATVWLAERLLARPLATVLRVESGLLRGQLTAHPMRSSATVLAIAVGFGAFISLMAWGTSMYRFFNIDDRLPRYLATVNPGGLAGEELAAVRALPGLGKSTPVQFIDTRAGAETEARFADRPFLQQNTGLVVIGCDLVSIVRREHGALPFDVLQVDPTTASAAVQAGTGCLIDASYAALTGLGIGDTVVVRDPLRPDVQHRYRIHGTLSLQGYNFLTKNAYIRRRNMDTGGLVFLERTIVQRDFAHLDGATHLFVEGEAAADAAALEHKIASVLPLDKPLTYWPTPAGAVEITHRVVHVFDMAEQTASLRKYEVESTAQMSHLPLIVLFISLFAVASTIAASIRGRGYELGVLRACGLSRGGFVRLIVAEGVVMAAAASVLGLGYGLLNTACVLSIIASEGFMGFAASSDLSMAIPWGAFVPGFVYTFAICVLTAGATAWHFSRQEPAALMSGANRE